MSDKKAEHWEKIARDEIDQNARLRSLINRTKIMLLEKIEYFNHAEPENVSIFIVSFNLEEVLKTLEGSGSHG